MRLITLVLVVSLACCTFAAEDQCGKPDKAFWETGGGFFDKDELLQTCYTRALVTGGDGEAWEKGSACMQDETPFSAECSKCFGDFFQCLKEDCTLECLTGVSDERCRECQSEETCQADFETCSGFLLHTCDTCVMPPKPNIIPGLDNTYFYVIVAVVGALAIIIPFCCYFFVCHRDSSTVKFGIELEAPKSRNDSTITPHSAFQSRNPHHPASQSQASARSMTGHSMGTSPMDDSDSVSFLQNTDWGQVSENILGTGNDDDGDDNATVSTWR